MLHRTDEHVGINCGLYCLPAHARFVSALISSIVATTFDLPERRPTNSSIVAAGFAARRTPLPSGRRSNSILSPGFMPGCFNTSLRKVTYPRAATVKVVMAAPGHRKTQPNRSALSHYRRHARPSEKPNLALSTGVSSHLRLKTPFPPRVLVFVCQESGSTSRWV